MLSCFPLEVEIIRQPESNICCPYPVAICFQLADSKGLHEPMHQHTILSYIPK